MVLRRGTGAGSEDGGGMERECSDIFACMLSEMSHENLVLFTSLESESHCCNTSVAGVRMHMLDSKDQRRECEIPHVELSQHTGAAVSLPGI